MPGARVKMSANVKKLAEERDKLIKEIGAIQAKVDGLNLAISVLQRDSAPPAAVGLAEGAKRATKEILLELLHRVGANGLNAGLAVQLASDQEYVLPRGSAASTLSRMKADGVVHYDGRVYRLPEYVRVAA